MTVITQITPRLRSIINSEAAEYELEYSASLTCNNESTLNAQQNIIDQLSGQVWGQELGGSIVVRPDGTGGVVYKNQGHYEDRWVSFNKNLNLHFIKYEIDIFNANYAYSGIYWGMNSSGFFYLFRSDADTLYLAYYDFTIYGQCILAFYSGMIEYQTYYTTKVIHYYDKIEVYVNNTKIIDVDNSQIIQGFADYDPLVHPIGTFGVVDTGEYNTFFKNVSVSSLGRNIIDGNARISDIPEAMRQHARMIKAFYDSAAYHGDIIRGFIDNIDYKSSILMELSDEVVYHADIIKQMNENITYRSSAIKTLTTNSHSLWDSLNWDDMLWDQSALPLDILTGAAIQKEYADNLLDWTGRLDLELTSSNLVYKADIEKEKELSLSYSSRTLGYVTEILESVVPRNGYTNNEYPEFSIIDEIWNDPVKPNCIFYYTLYVFYKDESIYIYDGTTETQTFQIHLFGDSVYILEMQMYDINTSDLLGVDSYWFTLDTVNPIIQYLHLTNPPVFERKDLDIQAYIEGLSGIASELITITVFTNDSAEAGIYQFTGADLTSGVLSTTLENPEIYYNDEVDVQIIVVDTAGNSAALTVGYNYDGDGVNPYTDFKAIQRYKYKVGIWNGIYTNDELQKKYCTNIGYDLEKEYVCKLYEANTFFINGARNDCPQCHSQLIRGSYPLQKKLIDCNYKRSTPNRSTYEDGLAILKFGVAKDVIDVSDTWKVSVEERSCPYGKDPIALSVIDLSSYGANITIHVEIQISRTNTFSHKDIFITDSSLSNTLCFKYEKYCNYWDFVNTSGLPNTSNVSIEYLPSAFIQPGTTFYYRWRIISINRSTGSFSNSLWYPTGLNYQVFTFAPFSTPTQEWDGEYCEHLIEDNSAFNGFLLSDLNSETNITADVNADVAKLEDFSAYRFSSFVSISSLYLNVTNLGGENEAFTTLKVRARSNDIFSLTASLIDSAQAVTDVNTLYTESNEEWKVFEFDLTSTIITKSTWEKVGIKINCSNPSYIDFDYIALINKNQTRKKYLYIHLVSNNLKCMNDEKQITQDLTSSGGICLKNHKANTKYRGWWDFATEYQLGDVVRYSFGSTSYFFVALRTVPAGVEIGVAYYWQSVSADYDENLDGYYQGGSDVQNPLTTKFCRNTACPDYISESAINEFIDFIYDPTAPSSVENSFIAEAGAYSGYYYCPNNKKDLTGKPACRNNFFATPIPPDRKICSRFEGVILNPGNLPARRFQYNCDKFNQDATDYQYDTGGIDATSGNYSTKIPADALVDSDTGETYYEKADAQPYMWDFDDAQQVCDGVLREDGSTVCGYPLVGYGGTRTCPDCGTLLIPYDRANNYIDAMKCQNNEQKISIVDRCHLANNAAPQPSGSNICYECGEDLDFFNSQTLMEKISNGRSITFSVSETRLLADGYPKTLAYKGWDTELDLPYSGPIGGSGGPYVYGDRWQGALTFKKFSMTSGELDQWEESQEISNALASGLLDDLNNIQSEKNACLALQYENNVSNGDVECITCSPSYNPYYNLDLSKDLIVDHGSYEVAGDAISLYNDGSYYGFFVAKPMIYNPNLYVNDNALTIRVVFDLYPDPEFAPVENDIITRFCLSKKYAKLPRWYNAEYSITNVDDYEKFIWVYCIVTASLTFSWRLGVYNEETSTYYEEILCDTGNIDGFMFDLSLYNDRVACLFYENSLEVGNNYIRYDSNATFPDSQFSLSCLIEKAYLACRVSEIKITGVPPDNFSKYPEYPKTIEQFENRNLKLAYPGTSTIDEAEQFYFYQKFGGLEQYFTSRNDWTETYYMIEIDFKNSFDSRRGLPMRRVLGNGYTCLRKSSKLSDNPNGFFANEYCQNYKKMWTDEEAAALGYVCPKCNSSMFKARIDSRMLALAGVHQGKPIQGIGNTNISHLLLDSDLPGKNNTDYLMLDLDQDGTIDQFSECNLIPTPFLSDSDENLRYPSNYPSGWTSLNYSVIVDARDPNNGGTFGENRDRWWEAVDTSTINSDDDQTYTFSNNFVKNSAYINKHDTPIQGRLLEQILVTTKTNRSNENSGFYYGSLTTGLTDISSLSVYQKQAAMSDIRFSVFVPIESHSFSFLEDALSGDTPVNVSRKIILAEVLAYSNVDGYLGSMKYIISDTLYDFWDSFGKDYTLDESNVFIKWIRPGFLKDKDTWLNFKINPYEDFNDPLTNLFSQDWTYVDSVEFRMSTIVIRSQDPTVVSWTNRKLTTGWDNNCRNVSVAIWKEFYQGWTTLIQDAYGDLLAYGPKTWNGIYYYRIIPYSFRLNPQWLAWYQQVALGIDNNTTWSDWPMEELLIYYGRPPQKWLYRFQDSIEEGQFNFDYSWYTTYRGIEHVILPDGIQ